jgi:hypothetical protein
MAMTPEVLAIYEEHVAEWLEGMRLHWVNTGNPLYVWQAIGLCFTTGARRTQTMTGSMPPPPGSDPYPLPAWCLEYLGTVAVRVDALMQGKDFRRMPMPFGGAEPTQGNWQQMVDAQPTLNTTEAAEMMSHATGIVRSGWNAFDRLAELQEMEFDEFSDESLRFEGKSAREAMNILLQESGVNDERAMRRRIVKARSARAKPTP